MIGDIIQIDEKHLSTAEQIFTILNTKIPSGNHNKYAVGIAGESGSGKSVTAYAVSKILEKNNIKSVVIQMDNYFKLPPKSNHENRLVSIDNVGTHEVNLDLLSQNIQSFKTGADSFEKPLVNYPENSISTELIFAKDVQVVIVEGTYILELDDFDFKIFIDRNFKSTYKNRMERNRDEKSDFVEQVLQIEHQIIKAYKSKADLILDNDYKVLIPSAQ
ncbi:uridine kinase family protein [Epilithonimonas tenax]|uniref:uridine kinase family protein n=1 Tax=Epilithonimonas tenax TaxID=191577 RepID=UPI0003F91AD7|nr:hypothetical protein [Epilithonimonas tenax]